MELFKIDNGLVKHAVEVLGNAGLEVLSGVRHKRRQGIQAFWMPEKGNLPVFDEWDGFWENRAGDDEDYNLSLKVDDSAILTIGRGDDMDASYLRVALRSADELPELLDFFATADAKKIGSSKWVERSLDSLIEDVYLLIQLENRMELLPFRPESFATKVPKLCEPFEYEFGESWEWLSSVSYFGFTRWISDHNLLDQLPPRVEARDTDLIVDVDGDLYSLGSLRHEKDSNFDERCTLVFRMKEGVSGMYFSDYLAHASDAQDLIRNLLKNWKSLPRELKKVMFKLPSSRRDQTAKSVELRSAKQTYHSRVKALVAEREPFELIGSRYQKRIHSIDMLHTETLDEIDALRRPLPYFLEYPSRHFKREDDHVQKIRAGQRLLGILAKVPLYLVVEELLSLGHNLGSTILAKLEERAPSDGTLVALQKLAAEELGKLNVSPLVIFSRLQELMKDTAHLDAMVTARNRMHHEPYDEYGFLKTIQERAPQVVDALRGALQDCRFIVPQHGRVMNGEKIITAEDACCSDAHFRTLDLKVTLPLEQFPSGELMVWTSVPEQTLTLGKLLTSKLVTRQSRDFGIFDRMQKNERHFTFLRSE